MQQTIRYAFDGVSRKNTTDVYFFAVSWAVIKDKIKMVREEHLWHLFICLLFQLRTKSWLQTKCHHISCSGLYGFRYDHWISDNQLGIHFWEDYLSCSWNSFVACNSKTRVWTSELLWYTLACLLLPPLFMSRFGSHVRRTAGIASCQNIIYVLEYKISQKVSETPCFSVSYFISAFFFHPHHFHQSLPVMNLN